MIKAKKHFGQNFLHDQNVLNKIIQSIPKDMQNIVEIGPGLGDLTSKILQISDSVTSYEIDGELYELLEKKFAKEIKDGRLRLFCADALSRWDESGLSETDYFLTANLPYYVATKMILNAIEDERCRGLVVMIQKEVAVKFSAKGGESEFSALAILASLQGGCELLFDVASECFNPPPKVTSSVIKIQKSKNLIGKNAVFNTEFEYEKFKKFLKTAFSAPRKTLSKNLSANFDKCLLAEIYGELNLSQNLRPHEIDVNLYLKIFEKLKVKDERRQSCSLQRKEQ
ncbi:16S rRNA (adenine(1518)-N(6)/adenine(1519)-N(6))-dimethyltransferase RsmA [Campylobacter sp. RM16189]|uniref:16S rRNA (adenine(1518)-N(6)/adenine(1519)-N(6))- dimethyltransferase RsmA n=1 Tax=Campylobacter sp. RM16189 TaxID=1705726 RepID=UPI001474C145|nr:16S rRNA (adenine(1518)-N(6)/adenine(1519)-N(6))-dimethyltransferase RsmA [Campylobacter sp. RM16189]